jgi:hypothetical protein
MPRTRVLRLAPAILVLSALAAAPAAAVERTELSSLPRAVQDALASGKVVLLESTLGDRSISTKVVAVIPVAPGEVVDEIRDYAELGRLVPGLRSLSFDHGDDHDTYTVQVKPHALLPLMELAKQVTIAPEDDGDVTVDVELIRSSYERIEGQRAGWQLLKLGETATLAIYETHDRYRTLPFRNRVLTQVTDGCRRLVGDVRDRCAERALARLEQPASEQRLGF